MGWGQSLEGVLWGSAGQLQPASGLAPRPRGSTLEDKAAPDGANAPVPRVSQ